MKTQFYGIRVTRKDGSFFLAYGTQPPCAVFRKYGEAAAFKKELQQHCPDATLRVVQLRVDVEEWV